MTYDPKAPRWIRGGLKIHFNGDGKVYRIDATGTGAMNLARALVKGAVPTAVQNAFARSFGAKETADEEPVPPASAAPGEERCDECGGCTTRVERGDWCQKCGVIWERNDPGRAPRAGKGDKP